MRNAYIKSIWVLRKNDEKGSVADSIVSVMKKELWQNLATMKEFNYIDKLKITVLLANSESGI